ncbi:MAG: Mur ligase family protein [Acidaminobacteraceae bacterium]
MTTNLLLAIFLVFITLYSFYKNLNDLHMFQLNSYMPVRYFRWYKSKAGYTLKDNDMMMVIGIIILMFSKLTSYMIINAAIMLVGLLIIFISIYMYKFRLSFYQAKKKLVYTKRVKRLIVTICLIHIIVFTFALYYLQLLSSSLTIYMAVITLLVILNIFSFIFMILAFYINQPIESNIKSNLVDETKDLLSSNQNLITIGITGSYGKTSVKNILHHLLSKKYHVLMTPESYNTTWGIIRTVRENLKPTHQVFIAEMGAKETGDIKEICDIVHPMYSLITSIGEQHLETFKTLENVIKTKGELFKYTKKGGTCFVNLSDENIISLERENDKNYIDYSSNDKTKGKYTYSDIKNTSKGTSFTLHINGDTKSNEKTSNSPDKSYDLKTKLLGKHNIDNLLSCISIALELGINPDHLNMLLYDIEPLKHRLSLRESSLGYTIIDDAFNSNPVGSKSALEVLKNMDGGKKIILTPGMIELGDKEYELNRKLGHYIADACDYVILVGKKQTQPIQDGLADKNYPSNQIYIAQSLHDGFDKINSIIVKGDVLLIENDLPDTFNE